MKIALFHIHFFIVIFFIYLYIYFWLCWVFVSVRGLSLVVASGGHSSSQCAVLSLSRPLLLRSTGSRRAGSVAVAHGPSRSTACGIFPDQGLNPCPLHWQADSQPLHHQGSPSYSFLKAIFAVSSNLSWQFVVFVVFNLLALKNYSLPHNAHCFLEKSAAIILIVLLNIMYFL